MNEFINNYKSIHIHGKIHKFSEINLNLCVLYFVYECTNSFKIYVNFLRVNTKSFPWKLIYDEFAMQTNFNALEI